MTLPYRELGISVGTHMSDVYVLNLWNIVHVFVVCHNEEVFDQVDVR